VVLALRRLVFLISPLIVITLVGDRSPASEVAHRIDVPSSASVPFEARYEGDYADPYVLVVGEDTYTYTTNAEGMNVPILLIRADGSTESLGDALPHPARWSDPIASGFVWAPSVTATDDGYVLYYSARESRSGRQCISAATATNPAGPFTDTSTEPLVCQRLLGGSIDPSPITVDGQQYLLWKNDGNCCDLPISLWIQPLDDTGLSLTDHPTRLLAAASGWEAGVIEAPSMIEHEGRFLLFYSANQWDSADYGVGYAVCATVTGPCSRTTAHAWLASTASENGPGGAEVTRTPDGTVLLAYHSWGDTVGYGNGGTRGLSIRTITFADGQPTVTELSANSQAALGEV